MNRRTGQLFILVIVSGLFISLITKPADKEKLTVTPSAKREATQGEKKEKTSPLESPTKKEISPSSTTMPTERISEEIESVTEEKNAPSSKSSPQSKVSKVEKKKNARKIPARSPVAKAAGASKPKETATEKVAQGSSVSVGRAGRVFEVSEDGAADTYLLSEALNLSQAGDKIRLKKGHYKLFVNHLSLASLDIEGEGSESVLEVRDSTLVSSFDVSLKKIKISNQAPGPAFKVSNGRKISLNDVTIEGNSNDGISVRQASIDLEKVTIRNARKGLDLKSPLRVSSRSTSMIDCDYGVEIGSDSTISMEKLEIKSPHVMAVFFVPESKGSLNCSGCNLDGQEVTNYVNRLNMKIVSN